MWNNDLYDKVMTWEAEYDNDYDNDILPLTSLC